MKKYLTAIAMLLLICVPTTVGAAQDWPKSTITIVVPFNAGGGTDMTGRLLAKFLSEELKVNVVVKNVAGATGTIGAAEVARAKPDGYTLGYYSPGPAVGMPNLRDLPYGKDSWECVALVTDERVYIAYPKSSPWNSFQEMVDDVKANPDKYVYSSAGVGGAIYISMKAALQAIGLQVRHIPERGSPEAYKALAGGTSQLYSAQSPELKRFEVKTHAIVGNGRSKKNPDIPTLKELGYDVPHVTNWCGLFAPKGTPKELVVKLSDAVGRVFQNKEFLDTVERMDVDAHYLPYTEFAKYYNEQFDLYEKLLLEEKSSKDK